MTFLNKYCFCGLAIFLLSIVKLHAQSVTPPSEDFPYQLMTTAMKQMASSDGMAMYFEGIVFGLTNPVQIFSMKSEDMYREGYYIFKGKQFELKMGIMNALCDGKVMVLVDEMSGIMYVDSVRDAASLLGEEAVQPDIVKMIEEGFGSADLTYLGKEQIKGRSYHKLKTYHTEKPDELHFLYWIDEATGAMKLMAEKAETGYNTYWIKNISAVSKNHQFTVQLPDTEMEEYYGYEVLDMRFVSEELKYIK